MIKEEIFEDEFNQLREESRDFTEESYEGAVSASLNDRDSADESMTLPEEILRKKIALLTLEHKRNEMNPSETLQYSESQKIEFNLSESSRMNQIDIGLHADKKSSQKGSRIVSASSKNR